MTLGRAVLVPVVNPTSAAGLVRMAAALAAADDGVVVPVSVVSPLGGPEEMETARELILSAEREASAAGVKAHGVVAVDSSIVAGVFDAAEERGASLVLMGWRGQSTTQNVFGQLIDSVLGRSSVPLAVVRLDPQPFQRILLPVSDDHLLPAGMRGITLATDVVRRLRGDPPVPVWVLRTGQGHELLPDGVTELSDRIHHDQRRVDLAVGTAARADDLIVVPVAPTMSGLRAATTHVAWAAPQASLLVAVDVGPPPTADLAAAVSAAGEPPPSAPATPEPALTEHTVVVTVQMGESSADPAALATVLRGLGIVSYVERQGQTTVCAEVRVAIADANRALATVMTAIHEAPQFRGAEIRYDFA